MYAWVPRRGRAELTKLILLILDIAFYDPPPQAATRTVEITISPENSTGTPGDGLGAPIATNRGQPTGFQQKATVPIGTSPDAVKLAHDVLALKQLLATHGLTTDSLIDYWARGIAGPIMSDDDRSNIQNRLVILCNPANSVDPSSKAKWKLLDDWVAQLYPCDCTVSEVDHARLKHFAYLWPREKEEYDGLPMDCEGYVRRLNILDFYRMASNCNALAVLGNSTLDKIAYRFLSKISPSKEAAPGVKWADIRQRLHDLEIPTETIQRPASPVPYGGILGTAINFQNALPTTSVLSH